MAKIQIKSEKLTLFGGFFLIMEQFDALYLFATLAQLSQMLKAIAQVRTSRLTKGNLTAEGTNNCIFIFVTY